ncbi:MAG: serine protease [Maioricimonas sp. JB049]
MMLAGESASPPVRTAAAETSRPDRRKTPAFWPFGRKEEKQPQVVRANNADEPVGNPAADNDGPLASTARLRVTIDGHVNLGTGTVVDSRPGRTIIVTCGHIFRSMRDDSKVEVDLFAGESPQTYVGRVLKFDLKADVGVVVIPTDQALPITPIAHSDAAPEVGDRVVSIGCSGGQPPSREQLRVTAINKYEGPANIECTGVPVQGRSGGGLFNADGRLVGVCIAADTRERRGLYAGLLAIHELLGESGLAELYETPAAPAEMPAVASTTTEAPAAPVREALPVAMETQNPDAVPASRQPQSQPQAEAKSQPSGWPAELSDLTAGDAEVVVIIRSKDDPSRTSRVVIINEASPKFYSYLQGEIAPAAAGQKQVRRAAIPRRLDVGQALDQDGHLPGTTPAASPLPSLRPTSLSREFAPRRYVRGGGATK